MRWQNNNSHCNASDSQIENDNTNWWCGKPAPAENRLSLFLAWELCVWLQKPFLVEFNLKFLLFISLRPCTLCNIMCAIPGKVSWRGSSWTLHVALYKLLHSSSRLRIWYKGTIYSPSSLDSFTLSRFRRSAFNVPEFPVNGRTAECAWILCFRWNISHPILWDLGAGIYILIIKAFV